MPRFAISDIHGCCKTFKGLLEKVNLTKQDQLYLLGDYIDRGPDSRGVIDYIWKLQNDGFQVNCLRGNHEQMLIDEIAKLNVLYNGEVATLVSFEVNANIDIPKEYIEWMKRLEYYFELEDYILVHAGLNFYRKDPLADLKEMMWVRRWYDQIDRGWLGKRIIVHGHTPTKKIDIENSLKILDDLPVLDIDAGCFYETSGYGNLCAFNLDSREFIFQPNLDK
ncbi:MAG: metallophosphoesterase family protein [Saprospiraceae bacterium]